MQFALPEEIPNTVDSLRTLEPQAPKSLKSTMLQAADELAAFRIACEESAAALELAATLKAGAMDSESRHLEVAKEIKLTLTQIAAKLRAVCE
jgi:uncharacterized alpha-E superfamily protein